MSTTDHSGLVATELVTGYPNRSGDTIVTRASFDIPAGTIAAMIGPNGSGKTTLLKTLLGLLPQLSGVVSFDDVPCALYRSRFGVGYLPEALTLSEAWSGRAMVALAAMAGGRAATRDVEEALSIAGVDFDLAPPLAHMSKGMRRRVALAMALLPLPRLLLLDEPEAGLDAAQRIGLRERITRFAREGRVVLLASHDVAGLCTIADRTYLLKEDQMCIVDQKQLSDAHDLVRLFSRGGVS